MNRPIARSALSRFSHNQSARALLADPANASRGTDKVLWRVWLQQPSRRRVELFRPTSSLAEVVGGDENRYWHYSPAQGSVDIVEFKEQRQPGTVAFTTWLHPMVSELLAPEFLWYGVDGAVHDPHLEIIEELRFLDRKALRAHMTVTDWDTRFVRWSENICVADLYDLIIDESTGTILRVGCLLDGVEFSVTEIVTLAFDEDLDQNLFEPPLPAR